MTQILSAPSTLSSEVYDERIATRSARVGIVGLGYAGLPLAMAFAEAGFNVVGLDLNRYRVDAVGAKRSYLVDVPAERYDGVEGRLEATTDYSVVPTLDALTICVPTPLSKTRTRGAARPAGVRDDDAPGPLLRRGRRRGRVRGGADRARPARRSAVDDVPGHAGASDPPHPRGRGRGGRGGHLPGLRP